MRRDDCTTALGGQASTENGGNIQCTCTHSYAYLVTHTRYIVHHSRRFGGHLDSVITLGTGQSQGLVVWGSVTGDLKVNTQAGLLWGFHLLWTAQ